MTNKIIIISPFPKKNEEVVYFSALGKYTKILLSCLKHDLSNKITVLKQRDSSDEVEYHFNGAKISPCWYKNSYVFFIQILSKTGQANIVHIQHEMFAYGNILTTYLVIFLEIILKIQRKKVIITLHSLLDWKEINKEYLKQNGVYFPLWLVRVNLFLIFFLSSFFADKIILHSEYLEKILLEQYHVARNKIHVVPLPTFRTYVTPVMPKIVSELKNKGYKIILFFGYIARYKGIEQLIESMKFFDLENNNAILLIAGSTTPRDSKNSQYLKWIDELYKMSNLISKNIIWDNRFIPENEIESYFKSSSLLIIPYPKQISSSGPLTFAINYSLPLLINKSFDNNMTSEFVYGSTPQELGSKLNEYFTDVNFSDRLKKQIKILSKEYADDIVMNKTKTIYSSL